MSDPYEYIQIMPKRSYHQYCPISYALDVIGERWTLFLVRELLLGPRRFTDLLHGLSGIGTNLLSQRLKDLEDIAFGFTGVNKAYAIQAGRELRVIVESEKVTDEKAGQLSFEISQKIQTDMTYPGQVKVTVIRETRAVNIAK